MSRHRFLLLASTLVAGACGLDVVGVAAIDVPDAAAPLDASAEAARDDEPGGGSDGGSDAPLPGCDETSCAALDAKWRPVAVAIGDAPATCASGEPVVLRTAPVAGAGACSCRAVNQVAPSCSNGRVEYRVGTGGNCPNDGVEKTITTTGCEALNGSLANSVAFAALAPTGGSCVAETVTDPSRVTSTTLTMCTPACIGDVCARSALPGFRACVVASGDVACDAPGFSEKHAAGTPTLACAACTGCAASATCTNVNVDLFTSSTCTTKVINLPANTCTRTGGQVNTAIGGMIYNVTTTPSYEASGPMTPAVELEDVRTVCCAP